MSRIAILALVLNRALFAAAAGQGAVPLFFVPNQGQVSKPVQFMVKGSGLTAYFLRGEIELVIAGLNVSMRFEGVNPAHQIISKLARRFRERSTS